MLKRETNAEFMTTPMHWRGRIGQRQVCFQAQLEICLASIVTLLKRSVKARAPCSSHFLRRVLLDDTWPAVSSFRGNAERISRGR